MGVARINTGERSFYPIGWRNCLDSSRISAGPSVPALVFRKALLRSAFTCVHLWLIFWAGQPSCAVVLPHRHTGETLRIGREHGKLVESWVCAWKQDAGREMDAYRAAKLMAAHGVDYLSAWSFFDYVSWDQCDRENAGDPELVWTNQRRAYREIREGDLELNI